MRFLRNVISTALIVLPMSLGAQESVDYLRRENKRLRYERDSLMAVIGSFRSMSISTWDMLTDLEFEDDIAAVFGSSSVIYNEDRGHSDLMDAVRRAAPAVATKWNQFIDDQIGVYTGSRRRYLPTIFGRYELWYPLFRNTFAKYGVPEELISLCIVESAVSRRAVSSAGAAGIWQLMPGTAKHYGLRVDEFVDERFDVAKATDAAARMLRDVHRSLKRWDLTVLSYNCGSGRVRQAIIKADGSSDVWEIMKSLPKETQAYLPSYLAARYVLSEKENLGINVRKQGAFPKTKKTSLEKDATLTSVAAVLNINVNVLTELNPQLVLGFIPAGVEFNVPS